MQVVVSKGFVDSEDFSSSKTILVLGFLALLKAFGKQGTIFPTPMGKTR